MSRVMAVWCPDWPTVAAARHEGCGVLRPLAVVDARGVVACNAAARRAGVRRGLRRREAQFRCPELVVAPVDEGRDAAEFEQIVRALDAAVPGIEVLRPGLVVLPADGAVRYHGGVEATVSAVVEAVSEAGGDCRVGLADELPTAVYAARDARCLEPGRDAEYLAELSVGVLVLEPSLGDPAELGELVALLRRLGVHTLGRFAELPARDVTTRFGPAAATAHRIAGAVPFRPPSVTALPDGLEVVHRCDPPLDRVDTAAFLGRRLAEELHTALAAAGVSCLRLSIAAVLEGGRRIERVWRCSAPLTPDATADRMRWQLEGWLTGSALSGEEGGPVVELQLEPLEVAPAGELQEGLWGEAGLARARVHRALARAQGLLGPDAVRVPVAVGGRGPGDRVRSVPYGETSGEPPLEGPWPGALPAPSPSVVWPDAAYRLPLREGADPEAPVAAELPVAGGVVVLTAGGEPVGVGLRGLLTGRPGLVELGGRRCGLLGWSRPWPVDERWWAGQPQRRARIQVVPERTAALLLGCAVGDASGRWRVEGVYE